MSDWSIFFLGTCILCSSIILSLNLKKPTKFHVDVVHHMPIKDTLSGLKEQPIKIEMVCEDK